MFCRWVAGPVGRPCQPGVRVNVSGDRGRVNGLLRAVRFNHDLVRAVDGSALAHRLAVAAVVAGFKVAGHYDVPILQAESTLRADVDAVATSAAQLRVNYRCFAYRCQSYPVLARHDLTTLDDNSLSLFEERKCDFCRNTSSPFGHAIFSSSLVLQMMMRWRSILIAPAFSRAFSDRPTTSRAVPMIAAISCWVRRSFRPELVPALRWSAY